MKILSLVAFLFMGTTAFANSYDCKGAFNVGTGLMQIVVKANTTDKSYSYSTFRAGGKPIPFNTVTLVFTDANEMFPYTTLSGKSDLRPRDGSLIEATLLVSTEVVGPAGTPATFDVVSTSLRGNVTKHQYKGLNCKITP